MFSQLDGGSERTVTVDANAFPGANYLRLINPMDAAFATADLTLPRIQLICDPESPAETGTAYLD